MTENKRYYVQKHLISEDKIHDKVCHRFMNLSETVEHMNMYYQKYTALKKENEQLKDALNQRTEQCDKCYKENERLKCINRQLEERHGRSLALDMEECE